MIDNLIFILLDANNKAMWYKFLVLFEIFDFSKTVIYFVKHKHFYNQNLPH